MLILVQAAVVGNHPRRKVKRMKCVGELLPTSVRTQFVSLIMFYVSMKNIANKSMYLIKFHLRNDGKSIPLLFTVQYFPV